MTSCIIRVSFALSVAAILSAQELSAQELQVDLAGNAAEVEAAAVGVLLDELRLIARTDRDRGRSVAGVDTESLTVGALTVGPLRLSGPTRLLMTTPLGVYPWSSVLTAGGGALLDAARVPSGRFGAALRADDAYVFVMRRSATLHRLGAGGRIRHGSGLEAELAAVYSRLAPAPKEAPAGERVEPRERMIHAVARFRGTGRPAAGDGIAGRHGGGPPAPVGRGSGQRGTGRRLAHAGRLAGARRPRLFHRRRETCRGSGRGAPHARRRRLLAVAGAPLAVARRRGAGAGNVRPSCRRRGRLIRVGRQCRDLPSKDAFVGSRARFRAGGGT